MIRHMVVYCSAPGEGYPTKQGIQSTSGRRIIQQDLLHVYESNTEYWDALGHKVDDHADAHNLTGHK